MNRTGSVRQRAWDHETNRPDPCPLAGGTPTWDTLFDEVAQGRATILLEQTWRGIANGRIVVQRADDTIWEAVKSRAVVGRAAIQWGAEEAEIILHVKLQPQRERGPLFDATWTALLIEVGANTARLLVSDVDGEGDLARIVVERADKSVWEAHRRGGGCAVEWSQREADQLRAVDEFEQARCARLEREISGALNRARARAAAKTVRP